MGKRGPMPKNKLPATSAVEVARPYKPTKEDEARERRYRAEDALRDIERAEKHKEDKNLMRDVKQLCVEKANNMKKVASKIKGE